LVDYQKREPEDIFKIPILKTIFKNRTFIFGVRVLALILFFYAIYLGFTVTTKENTFTRAIFWGIFWPLFIVVTLPTFGRIFCGICPHGFLGQYITKFGLKRKIPPYLANRYIGIMLLFIGWWGVYYIFPGVYRTPLGSAILFTVMTAVAFIFYYLYKDMAYCKYICPIGTALRAYSKLSFTWFGTYKESCKSCKSFECAKSCPYGLSPFNFEKKNSMGDCTLCMECAHSCEAIRFSFTKPGFSLYRKFKEMSEEVWVYILILAAIPISMAFHHGLGRSKIGDEFIWSKSAALLESYFGKLPFDAVGLFSFLYATLFSVAAAVIGLLIASKILKKEFKETFVSLGYAFAPLFILSSMGHALEFFMTSNYERVVEGIAWGFGFAVDAAPLAKRGDAWLMIFHLFKWIGVFWALLILYKRLKLIESSKIRKALAYPFAALLIIFFVGVNLYRDYVLTTYGREQRMHHGSSASMHGGRSHAKVGIPKKRLSSSDTVWLSDRVDGLRSYIRRGSGPALKKVWLLSGSAQDPVCALSDGARFELLDFEGKKGEVEEIEKRGCKGVSFKIPKSGYYDLYAILSFNEPDKKIVKVAKFEFKYLNHSEHIENSKELMVPKALKEAKLDILRVKSSDETLYSRLYTGEKVRFRVLFDGKPLANAKATVETEFGWKKELRSDKDGVVEFTFIKDYYPHKERYNKRYRERFLLLVENESGDTRYETTFFGTFSPSRSEYISYAQGMWVALAIFILSVVAVVLYRRRVDKPFGGVKIDED